jgi:hypothetical protein
VQVRASFASASSRAADACGKCTTAFAAPSTGGEPAASGATGGLGNADAA